MRPLESTPPGTRLAGFACATAQAIRTKKTDRSTTGTLSLLPLRQRVAAIAQPEFLHLHLEALAADLEQPRGLGHVAAGLVERLHDQLALDARGLGAHRILE